MIPADSRGWNAALYDWVEAAVDRGLMSAWRRRLWAAVRSRVREGRLLELGVGTGKSFDLYPARVDVTAVDISPSMLGRARVKAEAQPASNDGNRPVEFHVMDAQRLEFPDRSFDAVVASCVFCSVADPVAGLSESLRVLQPGGRVFLLEHVLSDRAAARRAMNALNPISSRLLGEHINRRTGENLRSAGFVIERDDELWKDIVRIFVARRP